MTGGGTLSGRRQHSHYQATPSLSAQTPHYQRKRLLIGGNALIIGATPSLSAATAALSAQRSR
jgi:hypothetical protein